MQAMSNPSDDTKRKPTRAARSRRGGTLGVVALFLFAAATGGVVLWQKYGGLAALSQFGILPQMAATQPSTAEPAAAEASDTTSQASDNTAQLLKDLQTSQQQTADKLEDIQRQLAAEQGERKLLSEQLAALSGRVNGLSTSNASVTTGMAAPQAAKKKPKLPDAAALRPAGANRQVGSAPAQ
jgi:hypothetical protein